MHFPAITTAILVAGSQILSVSASPVTAYGNFTVLDVSTTSSDGLRWPPDCNMWEPAMSHDLEQWPIPALSSMGGGTCPVEAHSCILVGCIESSAMFLCNDNHFAVSPDCAQLSWVAKKILNHCEVWEGYWIWPPSWRWEISGKLFYKNEYSVLIKGQQCEETLPKI